MAIDDNTIENAAQDPKRVRTAEGTVEERSVDELIKADKYTANKAATRPPFGLRMARTQPAGINGRDAS